MNKYYIPVATAGGLLLGILLYALFFYTPKPVVIDPPRSTKEALVTLQGTARPFLSIVVFGKEGKPVALTAANEKGDFRLKNVPLAEGVNELTLRAVASKWRVSFPLQISIVRDTTSPALSINGLNGAQVTAGSTVISGKAEPGSVVSVNGVETQATVEGTWTATVSLQPGKNSVTVAATDPAGNTTTDSSTIEYVPPSTGTTTGTATQTGLTTSVSPGSQPPPPPASEESASEEPTSSSNTGTSPTPSSETITSQPEVTTAPATAAPGSTSTTVPAPEPISSIIVSTYVSNPSPNERANETIFATVKDNFGRAVTNASVIAVVGFQTGTTTYSLTHQGNGVYSVSFKLNEKYVSGVRVGVSIMAKYKDFSSNAGTSFTPLPSKS